MYVCMAECASMRVPGKENSVKSGQYQYGYVGVK